MDSKSKPNLRNKQPDRFTLIKNMTDEEFNLMQENLHQEQKKGHIGSFITKCAIGLSIFIGAILAIPFGWSGIIAGSVACLCAIPVYKNFRGKEEHAHNEIQDNKRNKEFVAEADKIIATIKYNHSHAVSVSLSKPEEQEVKLNEEHIL